MRQIIVIPARIGSKRLKNKPLIMLKGKTMIERTFLQCSKAFDRKQIFVATDSKKINKFCKSKNINCIITSKKCLTGTDRVAEVAQKIRVDSYINVQGDEPIFNPEDIKKLINFSKKNPKDIINGYCKIKSLKLFKNRNIPKVVFDNNKNLLYMSRSPIPGNKKNKFINGYRQVCAYVYPRQKLLAFKNNKKTYFENTEDIEILRFLEFGFNVKMLELSDTSKAVDTKSDFYNLLKII